MDDNRLLKDDTLLCLSDDGNNHTTATTTGQLEKKLNTAWFKKWFYTFLVS